MIRATFELAPHGSAEALAIEESTGMPGAIGYDDVRGRVVSEHGGVAVVEFPTENWGRNIPMLMSALVAGEAVETRSFSACRLIDLDLPDGLLPGPAFEPRDGIGVGVIIKPSLGLRPDGAAAVARQAAEAGATLIKDDELMGDPTWCPLDDRVRAVAHAIEGSGAVYCANVTGPTTTLLDRARLAVDLGATGLMVNAFGQGLDSVLALRDADLGVPVLAHRVGSGPIARNPHNGAAGPVLTQLLRMCGADFVLAGAYGGKLFDTDDDVDGHIAAATDALGHARASTVVLGGGVGPDTARAQADRAGRSDGLLLLLGSAAYRTRGGVGAAVAATLDSLR